MSGSLAFAAPGQGLAGPDLVEALGRHADHPLVRRFADHGGGDPAAFDYADPLILQPATFVATLAEAGGTPAEAFTLVMGHSLGELSALTFAGAFSPDVAFELVVRRAELCRREADGRGGQMAAVLGLDLATVDYLRRIAAGRTGLPLEVACYNSATQHVVSGGGAAVAEFVGLVGESGGLVKVLPISGAYHSGVMEGAVAEFAAAVRGAAPIAPAVPLLSAIDGTVHDTADRLDVVLSRALVNPVRWRDAVLAARDRGIDALVELGPGRTLAKMARYDPILTHERQAPCY